MNLLKRTISIVSAIAISASIVISAMAAGFTDVSEQSPYYDAISYTSEIQNLRLMFSLQEECM